jgi:hypothetical protein
LTTGTSKRTPSDAGIAPKDKIPDEELSEEEDDSGDEAIVGNPDPSEIETVQLAHQYNVHRRNHN